MNGSTKRERNVGRVQLSDGTQLIPHNCHFTRNTLAALKARSWDLDVGVSTLVRDVIEGWLATTTNWEDPMFHRGIDIRPVPMPRERHPGYRKDLGFEE